MSKQIFARELGAYHWERLERLADHFGHANKKEYAVALLKRAIEESEMWMRSDLYAHYERLIVEFEEEQRRIRARHPSGSHQDNRELDDDIPF